MQKAERDEESEKPAEAMALRQAHWAGSTWASTPDEMTPRARAIALRLNIVDVVGRADNEIYGDGKKRIIIWVR